MPLGPRAILVNCAQQEVSNVGCGSDRPDTSRCIWGYLYYKIFRSKYSSLFTFTLV